MSYVELRNRADRVRGISLEDVLMATGARRDRSDKARWHTVRGTICVTGMKFINWNQGNSGGGAIDLAIHLNNVNFKTAVEWLCDNFRRPCSTDQTPPPAMANLHLPPPTADRLLRVKQYLIHKRGLGPGILEFLIETGKLYADSKTNAVFLLLGKNNKPVGAELRGTTSVLWRGMAPGSKKDLGYFSIHQPYATTIVLCESAIDAVSYFTLYPGHCCVSTAGARPNPLWLSDLIRSGNQVYCGFDADTTGDDMARAMIALHPTVKRLRPPQHDWNDVLNSRTSSPL